MVTFAEIDTNLDAAIEQFYRLQTDQQLALLWFIYKEMGDSITPAAPATASRDIAGGLYEQVQATPQEEQLQIMRDIARKSSTRFSREYGALSANTKLAFWYYLAQGMDEGSVIPMPKNYQLSDQAQELFNAIVRLEFQQQITILRNAVVNMGSEPAEGAAV
ncbi:orange carotenoid protein N-terminal domain-containing protein [Baaleninema sp.]|uniref:orange carotenoid protein N-terminal domain-containing protein n=1 Tax=Baaleninema sp. TaxID=3101197 RepID=UPI003CFFDB9F